MCELEIGQRLGGFVVFTDESGIRHAVRLGAVMAISDADDSGMMTAIQLSGNRVAVIRRSFDQVIGWFQ